MQENTARVIELEEEPEPRDPFSDPAYLRNWLIENDMIAAGIPKRFRPGFATYDERTPECASLRRRALAWANDFDPRDPTKGFALTGVTGAGKTHLAAAIARRLIERRCSVMWVNTAALFMRIRSTYGHDSEESEEDLIDELVAPDLLVLDDLGVERPTAWVLERLYVILNRRHEECKVIMFTSNYDGRELTERLRTPEAGDLADRLISRLVGMVQSLGDFPKKDWRKEAWRQRQ